MIPSNSNLLPQHNTNSTSSLKNISNEKVENIKIDQEKKHHFYDFKNISIKQKDSAEAMDVKRNLKMRHISMISLGGTIGTGIFISTGSALADAGPCGALIAYVFMATIVYSVAQSLGELATYIPITGSFAIFTTRYLNIAFGASMGWLYWFSWAITFAIELNTISLVIHYWTRAVPPAAWIIIFFVILCTLNLFPVKYYGEIEFWMASFKVIAIMCWLIYALCMVSGAGAMGLVGFRYWKNPGAMGPGILLKNQQGGRFMGFLGSLVNAAFTYQGCELVGVAAGETRNPHNAVPKAINRVFIRICLFYIGSVLFIGMLVPYNDSRLRDDSSVIASSPFLIAIINSGTSVLPDIFNVVILLTIISAGNSNVYIGSRILYALANSNTAPKVFKRVTKLGVPYVGVIFTSLFGLLSFMSVRNSSFTVFEWFVNISSVAGLICWAFISASHIRFMHVLKRRNIPRSTLPFKAKWQPFYSWYALILIIIITLFQGFQSFWDFTVAKFTTAYISVIVWVVLYLFFLVFYFYIDNRGNSLSLWTRIKSYKALVPLDEIDIETDHFEIDNYIYEKNTIKNWYNKLWNILV